MQQKKTNQGYLQLNRSSKDHLPNEPGDSSFSKELVVTLTGCVRVAALHHAPGVFGKVALQDTLCLGTVLNCHAKICKAIQGRRVWEIWYSRQALHDNHYVCQCRIPCVRLIWLCCLHWTSWVEISWVRTRSLFVSCNISITAETWDVWGSRCCSYVSRGWTSRPPKTGSVWKSRVLVYAHITLWTCIFQARLRWPLLMEGLSYLWTGKW